MNPEKETSGKSIVAASLLANEAERQMVAGAFHKYSDSSHSSVEFKHSPVQQEILDRYASLEAQTEIKLVLLPATINGEKLYRICYFNGWGATNEFVRCTDSGLLKGKERTYPFLKHKGQEYRFPAARAVFVLDGKGF